VFIRPTAANNCQGEIAPNGRHYNHIIYGAGVVFPPAGIPMAAGPCLGQNIPSEIINDVQATGK